MLELEKICKFSDCLLPDQAAPSSSQVESQSTFSLCHKRMHAFKVIINSLCRLRRCLLRKPGKFCFQSKCYSFSSQYGPALTKWKSFEMCFSFQRLGVDEDIYDILLGLVKFCWLEESLLTKFWLLFVNFVTRPSFNGVSTFDNKALFPVAHNFSKAFTKVQFSKKSQSFVQSQIVVTVISLQAILAPWQIWTVCPSQSHCPPLSTLGKG